MIETPEAENQEDNHQSKKKNKVLSGFLSFTRESLAILFWIYIITKLFIFDLDIFLVENYLPSFKWIIDYKFFILIGILSTIWIVTKNKHILLWFLYIFFYPLVFFVWKIPFLLFKKQSWNLVFAFIDSVISFFKSLKISFITTSFFLISTVIILRASNQILLWFAVTVQLIV